MIISIFLILVFLIVLWLFISKQLSLDLSGVLIAILVTSLLLATNQSFLTTLSHFLSISQPPLAIVVVAIGFLLLLVILLAVMISAVRNRQLELLRRLAAI